VIGIRREDKNRWERRVPLAPDHVAELIRHGIDVAIAPSPIRAFPDDAYRRAGARVSEDLSACSLLVGVKEIPVAALRPETAHLFFDIPMLRRLIEIGATLVDYEKIVDDRGGRLVFFGRHAGFAGMLDTLWALGRRLECEGIVSPFTHLRPAHAYADLEDAHAHLAAVATALRRDGVPAPLHPLVVGFTGSGNVSRGAQEIFDQLPHEDILPEDLASSIEDDDLPRNLLYKVTFGRADRAARIADGGFDAAELVRRPELYGSAMASHLESVTVLVNGVYWEPGQPRVVSIDDLRGLWSGPSAPRLRVIGDIACDLHGSIEATIRLTTPGDPVFVFDPRSTTAIPGLEGDGPVILAVDNLPCELPVDASQHFGDALLRFMPALARCDWTRDYEALPLPAEIHRAVIVHRGRLTPPFASLERHLAAGRRA